MFSNSVSPSCKLWKPQKFILILPIQIQKYTEFIRVLFCFLGISFFSIPRGRILKDTGDNRIRVLHNHSFISHLHSTISKITRRILPQNFTEDNLKKNLHKFSQLITTDLYSSIRCPLLEYAAINTVQSPSFFLFQSITDYLTSNASP